MRRFDFPTAPVIVGMILGPMAEAHMRNAISIGEGKWWVLVERPLSATIFVICALVLLLPPLVRWLQRRRAWSAEARA